MTTTHIVLTGASRGLGAALARVLCRPGVSLSTLARRRDSALQAHAEALGVTLTQYEVDLASPAALQASAQPVLDALPRDAHRYVLINNAGTVGPIASTDQLTDPAAIAQAFNLNVTAPMWLTAGFLQATPATAARQILNISSGAGRNARAGWGVYCATKAALDMYTRVLVQEHGAQSHVRAVSLAPGVVDTDMQAAIRTSNEDAFPARDQFRAMHATGKLASAETTAAKIAALLDRDDFGTTELDDIRHYD